MLNQKIRSLAVNLLGLGLLATPGPAVTGQLKVFKPVLLVVHPGPPDLVVHALVAPDTLPQWSSSIQKQTATLTISVENRFTAPNGRWPVDGNLHVSGSNVQTVPVLVLLSPQLAQVGNISAPAWVHCAMSASNQVVSCWTSAPLTPGGSFDILIDVTTVEPPPGVASFCVFGTIRASVDPNNFIPEVSETNNDASTQIWIPGGC